MKTVMKKLFSLMLVAVLLVSAVPFAASADTVTATLCLITEQGGAVIDSAEITVDTEDVVGSVTAAALARWGAEYEFVRGSEEIKEGNRVYARMTPKQSDPCAGGHTPGAAASCSAAQTCTVCGAEIVAKLPHTPGAAASCSAAQTCTVCGAEIVAKLPHTPGAAATCTTPQTCTVCGGQINAAAGHSYKDGKCTVCGLCQKCGKTDCGNSVVVKFLDSLNGDRTVSYAPGNTVVLTDPTWVSGYKFQGWKLENTSSYVSSYKILNTDCGTELRFAAQWEKTYTTPTYTLNVYARLYVGNELRDVRLIHSNSTMLENDKVLDYLKHSDTQATLWGIVNTDYVPKGYKWSGNFYNAYGDKAATDNVTTVDGAKNIYINLKASSDKVLLYVYTGSTCETYDYLYELDGYKAGSVKSTITSSEVRSFLKEKFGSGISIKMFDKEGFYDYWHGKKDTSTSYVHLDSDGITEVHVRLYEPSSSSAKPDSTNPKTGDMIFAPVMVMGASVTALAVLFFLNKKRSAI